MTDEQRLAKRLRDKERMAKLRAAGSIKRYPESPEKYSSRKARHFQKHKLHVMYRNEWNRLDCHEPAYRDERREALTARYLSQCAEAGLTPKMNR